MVKVYIQFKIMFKNEREEYQRVKIVCYVIISEKAVYYYSQSNSMASIRTEDPESSTFNLELSTAQQWSTQLVTEDRIQALLLQYLQLSSSNPVIFTAIQLSSGSHKYRLADTPIAFPQQEAPWPRLIWCLHLFSANNQQYEYFGMFELGTGAVKLIHEQIVKYSGLQCIRDVVLSPGNQFVYLLTSSKVHKLSLSRSQTNTNTNINSSNQPFKSQYSLRGPFSQIFQGQLASQTQQAYQKYQEVQLPEGVLISEARLHGSGEYIVATAEHQQVNLMIKISLQTDQMKVEVFGNDGPLPITKSSNITVISGLETAMQDRLCIDGRFLASGSLDFLPDGRACTVNNSEICIWDATSLTLSSVEQAATWEIWTVIGQQYPYSRSTTPSLTSVTYLSPHALMVDMKHLSTHYYTYSGGNLIYQQTIRLHNQYNLEDRLQVTPIYLAPVDSIFYFQQEYDLGEFVKLTEGSDVLLSIIPDLNQQIFWSFYDPANGLCIIQGDQVYDMHCYQLLVTCGSTTQNLATCMQQCTQDHKDSGKYWDSATISCMQCSSPSCECSAAYESVNMHTGICGLDCNTVHHAVPEYYQYSGECYCLDGYQWVAQSSTCAELGSCLSGDCQEQCPLGYKMATDGCAIDCTSIPYTVSSVSKQQCSCEPGFVFDDSRCQFMCPGTKAYSEWVDELPYCTCSQTQTQILSWNPHTLQCVPSTQSTGPTTPQNNNNSDSNSKDSDNKSQSDGPQAWVIVLILIIMLGILLLTCFLCFKKKRMRNMKYGNSQRKSEVESEGEKNSEQPESEGSEHQQYETEMQSDERLASATAQKSKRRRKRTRTKKDKIPSQNSIQIETLCHVCGSSGVDCQGPCSHQFHYNCIVRKISNGDLQCPYCGCLFVNGSADITVNRKS